MKWQLNTAIKLVKFHLNFEWKQLLMAERTSQFCYAAWAEAKEGSENHGLNGTIKLSNRHGYFKQYLVTLISLINFSSKLNITKILIIFSSQQETEKLMIWSALSYLGFNPRPVQQPTYRAEIHAWSLSRQTTVFRQLLAPTFAWEVGQANS